MPPKPKAVKAAATVGVDPAFIRQTRSRTQQLQPTVAEPVIISDAGHLEPRKAMSSAPKQNVAAKNRGRWGEDYLLTNPKSALVDADLVKLFSNPKAWECLEETEKRELLSLIPAHIHPNPDPDPDQPDSKIQPLPESFLRYDNNWRAALRNFQSDLESGRYRPEWQGQARQAVQERAQGKFDDFKEREFEQFWGQKQKINHGVIAGESSKVKLETLIKNELVRVGDVWKYSRIFGLKNSHTGQTVVEKEAKITAIDGATLSFLVPVGQRIFLSVANHIAKDAEDEEKETIVDNAQIETNCILITQENEQAALDTLDQPSLVAKPTQGPAHIAGPELNQEGEAKEEVKEEVKEEALRMEEISSSHLKPATKRGRGRPRKRKALDEESSVDSLRDAVDVAVDANTELPCTTIVDQAQVDLKRDLTPVEEQGSQEALLTATISTAIDEDVKEVHKADNPSLSETENPEMNPKRTPPTSSLSFEVEIQNIAGPSALVKKILEFDGRITNPPNGNAWKEIRCYRNNQDMGTLWDVRQAWYVKFQQE